MSYEKINQASKDAIEAGEIHEASQLNPADAGYIDKKGNDVKPFDPRATPEGSVPNPGDVAAAQRLRDAGKSDKEIAEAMNVRPDVVVAWLGEGEAAGSSKKASKKSGK